MGWRSVVIAGASLCVIVFLLLHPFEKNEIERPVSYSEDTILKAREQAKWSLVYVAQVIEKSERNAVDNAFDNVLMKGFPQSIKNVIKKSIPIFQGGQQ